MRISIKALESAVNRINDEIGVPRNPYRKPIEGESGLQVNIGTYYINQEYNGFQLVKMNNDMGGIECLLSNGTKRECLIQMQAYLSGIKLGKMSIIEGLE